jgi:hypothetical protein
VHASISLIFLHKSYSQLELMLFMSRVRYYHIAISHIALFRLSLLSECNILGEGSGRCSPDNIHSLKRSIDISVGESSGESYADRPTETYSMATPEHSKPLLLENMFCMVGLRTDLRRVSFYSTIKFLYHSSTIELLLSLIHIEGSYLSSKALLPCGRSSLALWLVWRANSWKVATEINTSS